MKTNPVIIPAIAPTEFILLENIPITIAGNIEAAANPNAKATTCATKAGGYIPNTPATPIAIAADILANANSCFSLIEGIKVFFIKS